MGNAGRSPAGCRKSTMVLRPPASRLRQVPPGLAERPVSTGVVTNVTGRRSGRRSHPQRIGVAIARVDAESMTRTPGERSLDTVGIPGAGLEVRLDGAAHLATDLLQDQRALALERSLRAGLAEGARRGNIGREEPAGDDRGEHGGDEQLDEREASLVGHCPVWLIQRLQGRTRLVSGLRLARSLRLARRDDHGYSNH